MGNKENRDLQDDEVNMEVKAVSKNASKIDARTALDNILNTLKKGPTNFNWIPCDIDKDTVATWFLRVPLADGDLKDEEIEIVHICRPIMLWEAIASNDPERTVAHSGYCWDGACKRCKAKAPEEAIAKFESTIKLLKLRKKIK